MASAGRHRGLGAGIAGPTARWPVPVRSSCASREVLQAPGQFLPDGGSVSGKCDNSGVVVDTIFEPTERSLVDPRPFGHVGKAQPSGLAGRPEFVEGGHERQIHPVRDRPVVLAAVDELLRRRPLLLERLPDGVVPGTVFR